MGCTWKVSVLTRHRHVCKKRRFGQPHHWTEKDQTVNMKSLQYTDLFKADKSNSNNLYRHKYTVSFLCSFKSLVD